MKNAFSRILAILLGLCLLNLTITARDYVVKPWPGEGEVVDSGLKFLSNSSGLDFYNGQLYAVDNGTSKFWIIDVATDGSLSFAEGFEKGRYVTYAGDYDFEYRPDTEGISVDDDGMVYFASERYKGADRTYNIIIQADPYSNGDYDFVVGARQWDVTDSMAFAPNNQGIESVEWVSAYEMKGKLYDKNTNAPFDPADYPDAVANGVLFAGLEYNGVVYAYVLNSDGSYVLLCEIDPGMDMVMSLDYDTYEHKLWAVTDNGNENIAAIIEFNGTENPDMYYVAAAEGVDTSANIEGFAIATADFTVDGNRPVYRFIDGTIEGSLTIGSMYCDYVEYENKFTDVSDNQWFAESVAYVVARGYMNGMSQTFFMPDGNIKREQFVLILANFAGIDTGKYRNNPTIFTDVETDTCYSGAVAWASEMGYVSGMSETVFGTGMDITRAQLARLFYVYAQKGIGLDMTCNADMSGFADSDLVYKEQNAWMKDGIEWAVANSIMSGMIVGGKLSINPDGSAARAQAAVMLKGFIAACR